MKDGIVGGLGLGIGSLAFLTCRDSRGLSHLSDIVRICGSLAGLWDVSILGIVARGQRHR